MTTIHDVEKVRGEAITTRFDDSVPTAVYPAHPAAAESKSVAKALALIVLGTAVVGAGAVALAAFMVSPPSPPTTVVRNDTQPVTITPSTPALAVAPTVEAPPAVAPPSVDLPRTVPVAPRIVTTTLIAPPPSSVPPPSEAPSSTPSSTTAKPGPTIIINIPRHDDDPKPPVIDPPGPGPAPETP